MRGLKSDERAALVEMVRGADGIAPEPWIDEDDEATEEVCDRLVEQGRAIRTVTSIDDEKDLLDWQPTMLGRLALRVCTSDASSTSGGSDG